MNTKSPRLLPITLGAGALGLGLRWLLYRVGFDEKGILSDTHPLHMACVLLVAGMAIWLALGCRKPEWEEFHRRLRVPAGAAACALMLLNAFTYPLPPSGMLHAVRLLLALGCAVCIGICVRERPAGAALDLVCHGVICVYFGADMLCRYQLWSGNPQLPDYCFHVLACVALTLCSYHRLAFDVGLGKVRMLRFTSLMALLLCLISAVGPDPWQFFLGGACWACLNLMLPLPEAALPEQPEEG